MYHKCSHLFTTFRVESILSNDKSLSIKVMSAQVFESEACRVWTGALGTPLHAIEDAEQHEIEAFPFSLQIWLHSQPNIVAVAVQSPAQLGLYLVKTPVFDSNSTHLQQNQSLLLPFDALSCFSMYRYVLFPLILCMASLNCSSY